MPPTVYCNSVVHGYGLRRQGADPIGYILLIDARCSSVETQVEKFVHNQCVENDEAAEVAELHRYSTIIIYGLV